VLSRAPLAGLRPPARWLFLALAAGIAALAVWLRLRHLDSLSFWLDEVASVQYAELPVSELWGADNHPPLFYFLLHYWMDWAGYDGWRLRLLSVVLSLATLPAAYLLGRRIGGPWTGLAATLALAAASFDVRYAQELRMYTLLNLGAAWALVGFAALLADPARAVARASAGAWALLVLGTIVALYAHNMGLLLPMTTTLLAAALWRRRPERRRLALAWIAAHGLVLAAWAPFLPELLRQTGVSTWQWIKAPDLTEIAYIQGQLAYGQPNLDGPLQVMAFAGFLALTVLGWRALPKGSPWRLALPGLYLLPALAALLATWIYRPVYLARPLIWTELPVAVLVGAGIVAVLALRPRRRALLGAALVLMTAVGNGYSLWFHYKVYGKANWRGVAELVLDLAEPGEPVVVHGVDFMTLDYYLERQGGEDRPRVLGDWYRMPLGSVFFAATLPDARSFLLADPTWGPEPPLLATALHWRYPCHAVTRAGERSGIVLWRYAERPGCAR